MILTASVFTAIADSALAGRHLGEQIVAELGAVAADAVIVFASSSLDATTLLTALDSACRPELLVGSSSAGEFTGNQRSERSACALAIRSDHIAFAAGIGHGVGSDRRAAARELLSTFRGVADRRFAHRCALVMTDALAGHADDLVEQLTTFTAGEYQFAGGGAGDDAKFARTQVFLGTQAFSDAVVGLEIRSDRPMGIGVDHGWVPTGKALRVTAADGVALVGLNGMPAADAFEAHARATGQMFDRALPLPFFLHNILGIDTGHGHRLRVPLSVGEDGSVQCAAEIPAGASVHLMRTTNESAIAAAENATSVAVDALRGHPPGAALFFDCVATRLRMGEAFGFELASVSRILGDARLVGCNTYGQIARADGQFGGFHNCTAVVLVLPA